MSHVVWCEWRLISPYLIKLTEKRWDHRIWRRLQTRSSFYFIAVKAENKNTFPLKDKACWNILYHLAVQKQKSKMYVAQMGNSTNCRDFLDIAWFCWWDWALKRTCSVFKPGAVLTYSRVKMTNRYKEFGFFSPVSPNRIPVLLTESDGSEETDLATSLS